MQSPWLHLKALEQRLGQDRVLLCPDEFEWPEEVVREKTEMTHQLVQPMGLLRAPIQHRRRDFYRIFHPFHIKLHHFQTEQIRTVESGRFTAAIGFGTLLVADIGGQIRKSPGTDRTVATVFKK